MEPVTANLRVLLELLVDRAEERKHCERGGRGRY